MTLHTCRNCGHIGHLYKDCPHPITSFGIIAYRKNADHVEYLMIQRKDSLSFMEFIRGKYDTRNVVYIVSLLSGMTQHERTLLITKPFEELWSHVWYQPSYSRQVSEFAHAKTKFDTLVKGFMYDNRFVNLKNMLATSVSVFTEPEWGFPKGRRRIKEDDTVCAVREFCEETNFVPSDIQLVKIQPFEEIFYGTNNVLYKHIYYLAKMIKSDSDPLEINPNNVNQAREVRAVKWFNFEEVMAHIRDHNQERRKLFMEVHTKILDQ